MSSMFEECNSLEILDLSYFDTSSVENMDSMFSGCSSLEFLGMSHFNLEKISKVNSMFKGVENLKYLNIFYIQNSNSILKESELNNINGLTVCQKQNLLDNVNKTNKCCYFDLVNNNECIYTNFMVIFFEADVEYNSGFVDDNIYRTNIDFIINGADHNLKLKGTDKLNLHKGSKIEIYFSNSNILTSIQNFFNSAMDINTERIILIDLYLLNTSTINDMSSTFKGCKSLKSIDLSYFDTSSVTNMSSMFEGCSSLETLDLSYFITSAVTNMSSMFEGCSSLEMLDLSYFVTSSVTDMNEMFYDCNSLTSLDISNFNMINCNSYSNMFSNISNIRYINLRNFKNDKIISSIFNKAEDLVVCQKKK